MLLSMCLDKSIRAVRIDEETTFSVRFTIVRYKSETRTIGNKYENAREIELQAALLEENLNICAE